ncbi:PAS domain-containing protein [Polyangium jinanense]|uniref:PAS domain-containing protein n=1 Tax=Polyangium jinanense TaxID=2829994 RepID=A0A9X3WZM3_9BACT|nr:PAS domain-containing protein [Polyangium jinanense]MDC3954888.1 PAS domain-containing protein [Polyangium jinanense]MDC3981342.1 PAS domain-containing protein [Polyangium jinanense]
MHRDPSAERFFRFQSAPCLEVDFDGAIGAANPAFCQVAGRSEDELQAAGLVALFAPDARAEVSAALARGAAREVVTFDLPLVRPEGELRWLEWRGVTFPEHRVFRIVAHDVTALWRAEAEARERERFLGTLLGNLPGMAYRCRNDSHWSMEFVSAGCEAVCGYGVDEMLENAKVSWGDLIHPEDRGGVWRDVQAAIDARAPYHLKYRIRTKSGEARWVEEQGRGVFDTSGVFLALEGFITDVTVRMLAKQELEAKLRVIAEQKEQIQHLSLPIIEVWDGVITLPVVGKLDDQRAERIMQGLLDTVVRTQSQHVIIDLTAVEEVDGAVAEHIVRILRAVQLLGAEGALSGMQPKVAQALVSLSADLGGARTWPDLRAALRASMRVPARAVGAKR